MSKETKGVEIEGREVKGIEIIKGFIDKAIDSGYICKIKCLDCKEETISVTIDKDIDLMCGECCSPNVEVEELR